MGWKEKEVEANGEWKLKQTEFMGYSKAQFDAIHETLKDMKEQIEKQNVSCAKNNSKIENLKGQITVYAMLVAAGISIIVSIITGMIK